MKNLKLRQALVQDLFLFAKADFFDLNLAGRAIEEGLIVASSVTQ